MIIHTGKHLSDMHGCDEFDDYGDLVLSMVT